MLSMPTISLRSTPPHAFTPHIYYSPVLPICDIYRIPQLPWLIPSLGPVDNREHPSHHQQEEMDLGPRTPSLQLIDLRSRELVSWTFHLSPLQ